MIITNGMPVEKLETEREVFTEINHTQLARLLNEEQKKKYGQYPQLGRKIKQQLPGAKLHELDDTGHIPHLQSPDLVKKALSDFL